MSRGRKPKGENNSLNWEQFYFKNVGSYIQIIIRELSRINYKSDGTGYDLFQKIKEKKNQIGLKSKILPEISPAEIPFEINDNWYWCRLGDIIEFTNNLNIENEFSKDTLINYVDIDAIDNKKFKIREAKLKTVTELSSRARRVLKKGYIAYSLVRPYLNNIAIIEDEKTNYIGSTGFAVFNGILIDNRFIKFLLLSDYIRELYLSLFSGFNSPSISTEQFILTPIPLPSLIEQKAILNFLENFQINELKERGYYFNSEIEKKIIDLHNSQLLTSEIFTENNSQLTQIENLNQAILQEAVQGKLVAQNKSDEPASELLKRIKAEKEKAGKKEKPLPPIKPEEIPFEIPESWVWCRLGETFSSTSGGTPDRGNAIYWNGNISWLKSGELNDNYIVDDAQERITLEGLKNSSAKLFPKGTLVIALYGATAGKLGILTFESTTNQAVCGFFENDFIETKYLFYYLWSFRKKIIEDSWGQAQPNISQTYLKDFSFALPPQKEQKCIVAEIEKQLAKTKQLKEHIIANQQATEQLLKALLHGAFEVEGG